MGGRVSLASMAKDPVVPVPGVVESLAQRLPLALCYPNPYNRELTGDLSDLAGIAERQLQSALAITVKAFLRLWPDDSERFAGASAEAVVVINGNRRLAAAHKYGRQDLIVMTDDTLATSRAAVLRAALDENTNREDLDPIEEAKAVARIVAEYATAKEAAAAQGWSQTWVSHRGNLLKLDPELQDLVRQQAAGGEGISINVARRLGSVKGIQQMDVAAQREQLAALLRADADTAAAKKESRQRAARDKQQSQEPVAAAPPAVEDSSPSQFSAENSSGAAEATVPPITESVIPPVVPATSTPVPSAQQPNAPEFSAENSPTAQVVGDSIDWESPGSVADLLIARMPKARLRDLVKFISLELDSSRSQ